MHPAEISRRSQLIGFRQFLVAEYEDNMFIERFGNRRNSRCVLLGLQVNATDFSTQSRV
jgi:hypothetical protein